MAISSASGFSIGSADAIDDRLVLSKAEMKSANDNVFPPVYVCVCKDNGSIYIYNKSNESDEETGKFRLFKTGTEFKVLVVAELPTEDIDPFTIYFVPAEKSEEGNSFDEFMNVNGSWERIGSTKIDLTPYLKTDGSNGTAEGVSNLINKLTVGESDPEDDDYIVAQYAGGGSETTSYHRRALSKFWNYIKGKISSVLGLTETNYGGNSATATFVKDSSNPSSNIEIDYSGTGLTAETATHLVAYGEAEHPGAAKTMRDMSFSEGSRKMGGLNASSVTDSTPGWGALTAANGFSNGRTYGFAGGGGIATAEKGGQSFMQVDGKFYQNEGMDACLDVNSGLRLFKITTATTIASCTEEGVYVFSETPSDAPVANHGVLFVFKNLGTPFYIYKGDVTHKLYMKTFAESSWTEVGGGLSQTVTGYLSGTTLRLYTHS